MDIDYNALSKEISYALRHAPQEYGLILDAQGWVDVDALISSLKKQEKYHSVTLQNILAMLEASEKKRHEYKDGRIRALYGHSLQDKIAKEPVRPPDVLYHGTARGFLQAILKQGLVPKGRQYVHLSEDRQTAITVGKRRDVDPVVLAIDAATAWKDGILFYHGNEFIWLADHIPASYLLVL